MNRMIKKKQVLCYAAMVFLCLVSSCVSDTSLGKQRVCIQPLYGFPDEEPGYEQGVSAAYAGIIGSRLVLAGGCNFPGTPAAEGGSKRYYKGIYTAALSDDSVLVWKRAGELPLAAAYGVSVSLPDGRMILMGGNNAEGGISSVFSLTLNDSGEAVLDTLPALPFALDNMAGAAINHTIYVVSSSLFSFNLDHPQAGWQEEVSIPGSPRMQPVCAVQEGMLYVWGGFSPPRNDREASVATDGYRYLPEQKIWESVSSSVVPKTGEALTLTGGTSIAYSDSLILCAGGVNKEIFLDAISGRYHRVAKEDYLLQPVGWYQFNPRLMAYNTRSNQWDEWAADTRLARAGAVLLSSEHGMFLIGGEIKPGIRTAEIVRIRIE